MTLHIKLHAFLTHLQCISEALLCTLMHCISDSACYATPHHPLHLHLCMCCLHFLTPIPHPHGNTQRTCCTTHTADPCAAEPAKRPVPVTTCRPASTAYHNQTSEDCHTNSVHRSAR